MPRLVTVSLVATLCLACAKKHETAVTTSTTTTTITTAASSTSITASTVPTLAPDDLFALSSGAVVVQKSPASDSNGDSWHMFDEDPLTGWVSESNKFTEPTVVELPDRSVIRSVALDLEHVEFDGRIPKQVLIETSDSSAKDGFRTIADLTIPQQQKDGVTFPVSAELPGRWVRVTVKATYGTDGYVQIMELRGFGERLTHDPPPNVTGSYKINDAEWMYLTQDGTQVTGCYSHGIAPLVGGMEGRLLRYTYQGESDDSGPALAIFTADGTVFGGHWKTTGVSAGHPVLNPFEGKKESDRPGVCPNEKKPEDQLASDLKEKGRVRLYGINFESDSATILDESKPALDRIAAMLKQNGDLNVTIEGHTDSTSTPEHNQQLSEERANAVKAYVAGAGVDVTRLSAAGFGATKPVATNDSPLGRAENRRVELARI